MKTVSIRFNLNGRQVSHEVPANQTLIDLIRRQERLLGTKLSCDQAVCGACTVLVNGQPRAACATFAFEADAQDVVTIEGLADGDGLSAVQQAFLDNAAFQCGYCTPGMIMLAAALLQQDPDPGEAAIRRWMGANICRCTGYQMIVDAVRAAAGAKS
jgi:carbon-monoxide dehydrogenase small subunit